MSIFEVKLINSLLVILLSEIQTIEFGIDIAIPGIETMNRKVKPSIDSEETDVDKRPLYICITYKNKTCDLLSGDEKTLRDIYMDIFHKLARI